MDEPQTQTPMDKKLDAILDILHAMEKRIEKIEESIAHIDTTSEIVKRDCEKMRHHISFVENTYEMVRSPLSFIKNHVEYIMGTPRITDDLPTLIHDTTA